MVPLTQPDWDYITLGPWFVSLAWQRRGPVQDVRQFEDLHEALKYILHPRFMVGHPASPERRVLFDGRGIMIFGVLDRQITDTPVVGTQEIFDVMEEIGIDPVSIMNIRMEVLWRHEESRSQS